MALSGIADHRLSFIHGAQYDQIKLIQWRCKDGNVLPKPVDMNNHLIDALRYSLTTEMNQNKLQTMNKSMLGLQGKDLIINTNRTTCGHSTFTKLKLLTAHVQ